MKQLRFAAIVFVVLLSHAKAQYHVKGEVCNEKKQPLCNVKVCLHSGSIYYTKENGHFDISSPIPTDTILLVLSGYDTIKQAIDVTKYHVLTMKVARHVSCKHKISPFTKNLLQYGSDTTERNGETYRKLIEPGFIPVSRYPQSAFALNVDIASYNNVRRFINAKSIVPPHAVRIEEMLNYFSLSKVTSNIPDTSTLFTIKTNIAPSPWNEKNHLFFINIQAPKLDLTNVAPCNFVFLIDVSGSMEAANRLPLVQSSLKLLVNNLQENDLISLVVYGGGVHVLLRSVPGSEKEKINAAIDFLVADGDTPGEAAIRIAYEIAKENFSSKQNNRIILITDGDFNTGATSKADLENLIIRERINGIYLSCIGVGTGNYKESRLEVLAQKGRGNFAYIDSLKEAEKVFITEFTKNMYAVADDASIQVTFNPKAVKEYRLIGFADTADSIKGSYESSEVEGGQIGSGHSTMAVFEVIPQDTACFNDLYAELKLQYKKPDSQQDCEQREPVIYSYLPFEQAEIQYRFATAIVMYGELLKQSKYSKNYNWDDVTSIAVSSAVKSSPSQIEFISLISKAKKIYGNNKKRNFWLKN